MLTSSPLLLNGVIEACELRHGKLSQFMQLIYISKCWTSERCLLCTMYCTVLCACCGLWRSNLTLPLLTAAIELHTTELQQRNMFHAGHNLPKVHMFGVMIIIEQRIIQLMHFRTDFIVCHTLYCMRLVGCGEAHSTSLSTRQQHSSNMTELHTTELQQLGPLTTVSPAATSNAAKISVVVCCLSHIN